MKKFIVKIKQLPFIVYLIIAPLFFVAGWCVLNLLKGLWAARYALFIYAVVILSSIGAYQVYKFFKPNK